MKPPHNALWRMVALLFVVVAIAYVPAFDADFIWDDDDYVTQNPVLRSFPGLLSIWFDPTSIPQYYPLVHTMFWVEFQLWGLEPLGYHLVNVLLHATGASLLLVVLRHLRVPGAWFAAMLFAVHPVHVESVAWITERKNVLSGVFYLWALLAWVRWRPLDGSPGEGGRAGYAKVLALFACALLSKTVACSLPAAILLLAWWKKGRIERRDVVATLPMFAIGAAMATVTVWLERVHVAAAGAAWDYSFIERVLIAGRATWFYLAKLAWPSPLAFNYPKWSIDAADGVAWLFPAIALATAAVLFALRHRIGRGPLTALLFFAGALVPALGFFDVFPMRYSLVADHFQYLASLGPITLFAAVTTDWFSRRKALATTLAACVIAGLGILTWRQCRVYDGHVALWTDTLTKNPESGIAHANLGKVAFGRGDLDRATEHYRAALAIDDTFWEAHVGLGVMLLNRSEFAAARTHFERVVELQPRQPSGHTNLGLCLSEQGELEPALARLQRALELAPRDPLVHTGLALTYARAESRAASARHLQSALEIAPNDPSTLLGAAGVLIQLGDPRQAAGVCTAVLRAAPGNRAATGLLARALCDATVDASPEETVRHAVETCRGIASQTGPVLEALARALTSAGRGTAAQAAAAKARETSR